MNGRVIEVTTVRVSGRKDIADEGLYLLKEVRNKRIKHFFTRQGTAAAQITNYVMPCARLLPLPTKSPGQDRK